MSRHSAARLPAYEAQAASMREEFVMTHSGKAIYWDEEVAAKACQSVFHLTAVARRECHGLEDIGNKEISANIAAAGVFRRSWLVRAISGGSIAWHR